MFSNSFLSSFSFILHLSFYYLFHSSFIPFLSPTFHFFHYLSCLLFVLFPSSFSFHFHFQSTFILFPSPYSLPFPLPSVLAPCWSIKTSNQLDVAVHSRERPIKRNEWRPRDACMTPERHGLHPPQWTPSLITHHVSNQHTEILITRSFDASNSFLNNGSLLHHYFALPSLTSSYHSDTIACKLCLSLINYLTHDFS